MRGIAQIRRPDFISVEQAVDKALAGHIHQAHDLGALVMTAVNGRDIGNERQRRRIEYLHAARFVVGDGNQPAVLRDRAADAVAGLHDAFDDAAAQDIDLGQTAIATEHIA